MPDIPIADEVEQEMSDIVQAVVKGDSLQKVCHSSPARSPFTPADDLKNVSCSQRIEELSRILSSHPEKRGKFDELVAHIDPALSVFLKRALANRMPRQGSESPAVSHVAGTPTSEAKSPTSPSQPPRFVPSSLSHTVVDQDQEEHDSQID